MPAKMQQIFMDLNILHKGINFNDSNTTQFTDRISRQRVARRDAGLICISFEMPHDQVLYIRCYLILFTMTLT